MSRLACKYHEDADLIEDSHAGDMVCALCGLVVADRVIDVSAEWRTFGNDTDAKDMSRVGATENSLLSGSELTTCVDNTSNTGLVNEAGRPLIKNRSNLTSADRALSGAFREISQMADRLNLPKSVSDQANVVFKKIYETKAIRGRSNDASATACLYMACRQEGVARTFKEVCAVSRVSKKEIGKMFKKILSLLETTPPTVSMKDFLGRFCANLGLDYTVQKTAEEIAHKAGQLHLIPGRSPVSVTAAAVYMAVLACGIRKDRKEISQVSGVAEVTISAVYKMMRTKASQLFSNEFKFVIPPSHLPYC